METQSRGLEEFSSVPSIARWCVCVIISFYFRIRYLFYKVVLMVLVEDIGVFRQEVQTAGCSLPCKVEIGEHL